MAIIMGLENGSHIGVSQDQDLKSDTHPSGYDIPSECKKLLVEGILHNPLMASNLPPEAEDLANLITFEGSQLPSIPVVWRYAESISALKGLETIFINVLLKRKYGFPAQKATINTDQAQLFIMSTMLYTIDPNGDNISSDTLQDPEALKKMYRYFPNWDKHRLQATPHRQFVTNIYRTRDDRFFHLHGSMNPDPTFDGLKLPYERDFNSAAEAIEEYRRLVAEIDSTTLDEIIGIQVKQAGTICWSTDEFEQSDHGKANAHVGLWETHYRDNPLQKPCWWQDTERSQPSRPLAGLKVIELGRAVAAPTITRGLAELGASVMRITAPHLCDLSSVHPDLNWGKWNASLDLRNEEDRQKLRDLVATADIFVQGYRPGVFDKYSFGEDDLFELTKSRTRGLIYIRENCFGWQGPWKDRTGWQQISDACCGVSMEFGRAMGHDEPVTPVFPNSDYCTGEIGTVAALDALIRRAEKGGSYTVDIALNYYSQWLTKFCGKYPEAVWQDLWNRNGRQVFRHYHSMPITVPAYMKMLKKHSQNILFKPCFFEDRYCHSIGKTIRHPKCVIDFVEKNVVLGYNISTRTNGVDRAAWPEDLCSETVD